MSINQLLNQYQQSSSQREQGINNYLDKNYGKDSALLNLPVESGQSRLQEISAKFMDDMGIDLGAKGLYGIGLRGIKYAWGDNAFKDLGNAIGDRLPSFDQKHYDMPWLGDKKFITETVGVYNSVEEGLKTFEAGR
ncbi:MAG: hypothetical protein GY756_00340, partial [bacterium]|nr:hypothetical protein [bacterium]